MICFACQNIFSNPSLNSTTAELLHSDLRQLQVSAEGHCQICRSLWNSLVQQKNLPISGDLDEDEVNSKPLPTSENWWDREVYYQIYSYMPGIIILSVGSKDGSRKNEKWIEFGNGSGKIYPVDPDLSIAIYIITDLKVIIDYCVKSKDVHRYRPVALNTNSEDCWSLVKNWIAECSDSHPKCRRGLTDAPNTWYPSRLIDLGPASDPFKHVRLVITKESPITGPYNTLSHCWGTNLFLTLSTNNLETFKEEIPYSDLTKTFQDAITVTRKLGVRYLWIDSICILQSGPGSEQDWQNESAQMHHVYERGYCNIAATASQNGSGGLFYDRNPLDIEVTKVVIDWPARLNKNEILDDDLLAGDTAPLKGTYTLNDDDFWTTHKRHCPLSRRAWVLQEYMFATRALHFGKAQIFWECKALHACESHPAGLPTLRTTSFASSANADTLLPPTSSRQNRPARNHPSLPQMRWPNVVRAYTACKLTKESDKLIALSGVAQRYLETTDSTSFKYLAGLWSGEYLLVNLLWRVDFDPSLVDGDPHRPQEYRAPSWSWASVEGSVSWHITVSWGYNPATAAVVLDAFTVPKTSNVTGQVTGGQLTIEGVMLSSQLHPASKVDSPYILDVAFGGSGYYCRMNLDEHKSEAPITCYCLALIEGSGCIYGLGLTKTDNGLYKRIGCFILNDMGEQKITKKRFQTGKPQKISII